ncbi:ABC transporter permease [Janthinobacterium sp.]|uniref:ABC transporter permease n=1 Tax=Janthinobacterium sp. TaxID=1871054 RepID=UPI00293D625B|nr:FtsX-like permease family protein [Janthinobacterium sp.]
MEIRPILSTLLRNKTGALLLILQVALSLAILVNALHIVGLRLELAARPSGVADEASVIYLRAKPVKAPEPNAALAQRRRTLARLRAMPGVQAAALSSQMPLSRAGWTNSVRAHPDQAQPSADAARYNGPDGLIQTWGLRLLEGRDFTPADLSDPEHINAPAAVIVTRALARRVWPDAASAVGRTLYFSRDPGGGRVIGVVERLQTQGADNGPQDEYSVLTAVRDGREDIYTLRAAPGRLAAVTRDAEALLGAEQDGPAVISVGSVAADRAARYQSDIALAWMLVAISALLLLVTASGIVGISSLWVAQRRRQIGVRRALGARRADILRYFLTENLLLSGAGVGLGAALALALNQLLVSQLQLARLPPSYLAGGAVLFCALGLAAVFAPAWRAASISPASATRDA